MPFGLFTPEMEALVAPQVVGATVWDLGAGDLTYARRLVALGADRVLAVDKESYHLRHSAQQIEMLHSYFDDLEPQDIEVAFVSWPQNKFDRGLLQALDRADVVIYLGCNTDHSACGSPELFRQLCGRELLGHVPHRRNTLLIYGRGTRTGPLTGEEFADLTGALLSFEEAVEKAAENTTHWV